MKNLELTDHELNLLYEAVLEKYQSSAYIYFSDLSDQDVEKLIVLKKLLKKVKEL